MNLKQLGRALQDGEVLAINIITHSGLNRYAVQVVTRGSGMLVLRDSKRQPLYWRSVAQLQAALRRRYIAPPQMQVLVAHDEVIGR